MEKAIDVSVTGETAVTFVGGNPTVNINHAGYNGASSQFGRNISGSSCSTPISNCNEPFYLYCSRKKLDEEIEKIQKGKLNVLYGTIGTGKTSAALQYILANKQRFAVSWFIDVSNKPEVINNSLTYLAKKLRVSYDELFSTLEQIAEDNEIIFLLDNLEKWPSSEWFDWLWNVRKESSVKLYIIATTNNLFFNLLDAEQIQLIHVDEFEEALEFLKPVRSEDSEDSEEDLYMLELCRHFGWNIMGLSAAKDYMLMTKTTTRTYLQMQRDSEAAENVRQVELNYHDSILYVSVRRCLKVVEVVDSDKFSAIAATTCIYHNTIPEFLLSSLLSSSSHLANRANLSDLENQLKSLVRITEENGIRFFSFHSFTQYVISDMIDEQMKVNLLYKLAGIFMKYVSKDNRFSIGDFLQRTVREHAEIFLREWEKKEKDDRTLIALARLSELVAFTYTQQQPPLQDKLDVHFKRARDLLHKLCEITEDDLQPAEGVVREMLTKLKHLLWRSSPESSHDVEHQEMYGITNSDLVIAYQLFTKLSQKSLKLSPDIIEELVFLRTVNKKDLHMFPEIVRENPTVKEKIDSSQPLSASDVSVFVNNGAAYSVDRYRELFLPELYLSVIYSFGRNYFYKDRATMENPHFYINLLKLAYCLSREISKRTKPNAVFHEFVVQTNGLLYLLVNDDYFNEDEKYMKKDAQVHARDLKNAIERYQQLILDERTFFEMGILKRTKDDTYSKLVCYQQMLRCHTNLLSLQSGEDRNQCIQNGVRLCEDLLEFLGIDDNQHTGHKKEDIVRYSRHMNAIAEFYLTIDREEYYTRAIKIFTMSAEHAEKYDMSLFCLEALVGLADLFSRNGKHRFSATQVSIRHLIHCNSKESLREMQRQKPHIQERIRKIQNRNLAIVLKWALLRRKQEQDGAFGSHCSFDEPDVDPEEMPYSTSCDDRTTDEVSNDGSSQETFNRGQTRERCNELSHVNNKSDGTVQHPSSPVLFSDTVDRTPEGSTRERSVERQRVGKEKIPQRISQPVLSSDTVDQTLQDNPMERHLLRLAKNIPGDWKQVGTFLGVSCNKIEEISLNHPNDVSWQAYKMLQYWWSSHDEAVQPWREKLSNALREIGRHDLAIDFTGDVLQTDT